MKSRSECLTAVAKDCEGHVVVPYEMHRLLPGITLLLPPHHKKSFWQKHSHLISATRNINRKQYSNIVFLFGRGRKQDG